jgi:hypothetical protein
MSNIIKFSINGDTNADQVTEKVKKSVSTLEKNMEGVQARFKNFGKDLFLSFAAPMVLLNAAMNMISSSIEKSRQQVQDAKAVAEGGGNRFMRAGTVTSAQEAARRRQDALDRQNAKLGAEAVAREQGEGQGYGGTSGKEAESAMASYVEEGKGFWNTAGRWLETASMGLGLTDYAKNEDIQKILERRAAGRAESDPAMIAKKKELEAAAKEKADAEAKSDAQKALDLRGKGAFAGSEGFSNVVGVGANPVLTAVTAQLDEQRKHTALLQQIAMGGSYTPPDFTKQETANPQIDSRGGQL